MSRALHGNSFIQFIIYAYIIVIMYIQVKNKKLQGLP